MKDVGIDESCPVDLRRHLLFALRHFPLRGQASHWASGSTRCDVSDWLQHEDFYS